MCFNYFVDIKDFSRRLADFLADSLEKSSFDINDESKFFKFPTSVSIGEIVFNIYSYRDLLPLRVNKNRPEDVHFTFFVGRAKEDEKARFLEEVQKQRNNQPTDTAVISRYMNAFQPDNEDYKNLCDQLKVLLEQKIYEGKGFEFSVLFTAPNKDFDPIIVFCENGSIGKLQEIYPDKVAFDLDF